jgi:hypothetical protein
VQQAAAGAVLQARLALVANMVLVQLVHSMLQQQLE